MSPPLWMWMWVRVGAPHPPLWCEVVERKTGRERERERRSKRRESERERRRKGRQRGRRCICMHSACAARNREKAKKRDTETRKRRSKKERERKIRSKMSGWLSGALPPGGFEPYEKLRKTSGKQAPPHPRNLGPYHWGLGNREIILFRSCVRPRDVCHRICHVISEGDCPQCALYLLFLGSGGSICYFLEYIMLLVQDNSPREFP